MSSSHTYLINQSFPKGKMFAAWLGEVGASTVPGETVLTSERAIESVNAPALPWISSADGNALYFTVNTPISKADGTPAAPETQCGRAVLTGLHVNEQLGALTSIASCPISPGGLNAQQAALEFLFFDLSACVASDNVAPSAPK